MNGDFSQGTTGWRSLPSTSNLATERGEMVVTAIASGRVYFLQWSNWNHPSGQKVYIAGDFRANKQSVCTFGLGKDSSMLGIVGSSTFNISTTKQRLSVMITSTDTFGGFRLRSNDLTTEGDWVRADNITLINLTALFGAGNEPTKLEMDELMKVIPNGWWNGEISLTQKQFMTWLLNLQRKNTNAIIALGGTII